MARALRIECSQCNHYWCTAGRHLQSWYEALMVHHSVYHSTEWKVCPNPPKFNAKEKEKRKTEELSLEDINAKKLSKNLFKCTVEKYLLMCMLSMYSRITHAGWTFITQKLKSYASVQVFLLRRREPTRMVGNHSKIVKLHFHHKWVQTNSHNWILLMTEVLEVFQSNY